MFDSQRYVFMREYMLFLGCLLLCTNLFAQDNALQTPKSKVNPEVLAVEDTLKSLGQTILNDSLLINRQNANTQFVKIFEAGMALQGAYEYTFDSLLSVSKLTSPDNSFKIFTWQFFEGKNSYVYYGYVLHQDGRIVRLIDQSNEYYTPQFEVGDKDHWYGALYYNMRPFTDSEGKMQYLMFGYDGNSLLENRKIIDVLSWDEKGAPVFGAPVFQSSTESRGHPPVMHRVLMEYFAQAKLSCNYEEIHSSIIYDHLIFTKTPYGEFMIPDGSYEGYVYEEGKWRHVAKMFHHSYGDKNYPVPEPVLTNKTKKDIFGKEHKRNSKNVSRDEKLYKKARTNNKKKDAEKKDAGN